MTDTHTHLFSGEFEGNGPAAVQSAIQAGVSRMYLPNIDSASIAAMIALEKQFPENCFAMMGLHPCSVNEKYGEELAIVEHWLAKRKFIAVGEIGMDYHWDKTFIAQQKDAFSMQIGLAKKHGLPIVIHQRECFEDTLEIVKENNDASLKGVFHCFTGTIGEAKQIIALGGFKMGIGGVVTYKKSTLPEVLKETDLRHFVLETDSPYLAPAPHRGKRNESAYLTIIAARVAEIKGISIDEVAEVTTQNAKVIFG